MVSWIIENEEDVVAIGSLKPDLIWSRYPDANPVPTSPLADDLATAPSGPVNKFSIQLVFCFKL